MTVGNIFICIVSVLYLLWLIIFIMKYGNPWFKVDNNIYNIKIQSRYLCTIFIFIIISILMYLIDLLLKHWNTII